MFNVYLRFVLGLEKVKEDTTNILSKKDNMVIKKVKKRK